MQPDGSGPDDLAFVFVLLIYLLPVVGLVVFGFIGRWVEKKHYEDIRRRERATAHLPAMASRTLETGRPVAEARLVAAEVVISHDYFKRFLANLRNIFGGRLRAYETLLDRARREAVLRLKESAPQAHVIANLRLETACIAKARGKQGIVAVEVIASGTAVRYGA